MTTPNRISAKVAALAVGGLVVGLMAVAPGTASAAPRDVVSGQFVSKEGLNCGGQELITGDTAMQSKQHAWIYYNCSDSTLRRYADVVNAGDGDCYGIGPGEARVLHAKSTWFDRAYRGSKNC